MGKSELATAGLNIVVSHANLEGALFGSISSLDHATRGASSFTSNVGTILKLELQVGCGLS